MDSKSSKQLVKKTKAKQRSAEYLEYQRYIRSKEFKKIRELVLERDNHTCQCCNWRPEDGGKRSLSAHHRTYKHLFDEGSHLEDLITLCSVCHRAIHSAPSNFQRFKNKKNKNISKQNE